MSGERLIGKGLHAKIWQSADGKTARKRYVSVDGPTTRQLAQRERETLLTASSLLAGVPGVRVPEPFDADEQPGELTMEYCPGDPLHVAVGGTRFAAPGAVESTARDLAEALLVLAERLPIGHFDLSPRNTLYDADRDELVLIDFTPRKLSVPRPDEVHPVDFTLGSFLAAALSIPLHRDRVFHVTASRRLVALSREMVGILATRHRLDHATVRDVASRHYEHRSRNAGLLRRAWFCSVGRLVFGYLLHWTLTSEAKN